MERVVLEVGPSLDRAEGVADHPGAVLLSEDSGSALVQVFLRQLDLPRLPLLVESGLYPLEILVHKASAIPRSGALSLHTFGHRSRPWKVLFARTRSFSSP